MYRHATRIQTVNSVLVTRLLLCAKRLAWYHDRALITICKTDVADFLNPNPRQIFDRQNRRLAALEI